MKLLPKIYQMSIWTWFLLLTFDGHLGGLYLFTLYKVVQNLGYVMKYDFGLIDIVYYSPKLYLNILNVKYNSTKIKTLLYK